MRIVNREPKVLKETGEGVPRSLFTSDDVSVAEVPSAKAYSFSTKGLVGNEPDEVERMLADDNVYGIYVGGESGVIAVTSKDIAYTYGDDWYEVPQGDETWYCGRTYIAK